MVHLTGKVAALGLVLFCGAMRGQAPQPSAQFPDIPKNMKSYFVALYVKGAKADQPQTKEERDTFIVQHTAYLRSQVEAGKYLLVGPLTDNGQVRGIAVINAASAEEAGAIANADPGVRSGRMAIEIHPAFLPDLASVRIEYQSAAGK